MPGYQQKTNSMQLQLLYRSHLYTKWEICSLHTGIFFKRTQNLKSNYSRSNHPYFTITGDAILKSLCFWKPVWLECINILPFNSLYILNTCIKLTFFPPTDLPYTSICPILIAQDWRQLPRTQRSVCFWKMCTTGDGEIFINGGRGDHSDSPVVNNRLHKGKVNSWCCTPLYDHHLQ